MLRPGLVKGPWTKEEDDTIVSCIKGGITKWSEIAARIPGRIGKQCRERWFNHLDPDIKKGGWSVEEDRILEEQQALIGAPRPATAMLPCERRRVGLPRPRDARSVRGAPARDRTRSTTSTCTSDVHRQCVPFPSDAVYFVGLWCVLSTFDRRQPLVRHRQVPARAVGERSEEPLELGDAAQGPHGRPREGPESAGQQRLHRRRRGQWAAVYIYGGSYRCV